MVALSKRSQNNWLATIDFFFANEGLRPLDTQVEPPGLRLVFQDAFGAEREKFATGCCIGCEPDIALQALETPDGVGNTLLISSAFNLRP